MIFFSTFFKKCLQIQNVVISLYQQINNYSQHQPHTIMKTLEIGKKYHLYNGWAKNLDDVWHNDMELVKIEESHGCLTELEFKYPNGKTMWIDLDFMRPYNHAIKKGCWMFIEKPAHLPLQ